MKLNPLKLLSAAITLGTLALCSPQAHAANPFYAPGDLVLHFQNPNGSVGSDKVVFFSLGSAQADFRDAIPGDPIVIGNIGSELNSTFGSTWFDETTLFVGAVANVGTNALATALVEGDPSRTVYSTKARNFSANPGETLTGSFVEPAGAAGIATAINASNNKVETLLTTAAGTVNASATLIPNYNPFVVAGQQSTAYTGILAGVQARFGANPAGTIGTVGSVEAGLDLFRHQPRSNLSGQYGFGATDNGTGQFLGTIAITQSGDVVFIPAATRPDASYAAKPFINRGQTVAATVGEAVNFPVAFRTVSALTDFSATGLPAGLSIATNGVITGTPSAVGSFTATLQATNAGGTSSREIVVNVASDVEAPVITSSTAASGTVNVPFNFQITASNAPTSYAITSGTLPAGLSLNTATGLISGTPTAAASATVGISASNNGGTGTASLTITILSPNSPPVINGPSTVPVFRGVPLTGAALQAVNNATSFARTAGTLPAGLVLTAATGNLGGTTLVAAGSYAVTFTARNSFGVSSPFVVTFQVQEPPAPSITSVGTIGSVPFQAYNTFASPTLQVVVDNPDSFPLRYQWRLNGRNIAGATQPTYTIPRAGAASVGTYDVVVTNAAGVTQISAGTPFSLIPAATFNVTGPQNQILNAGSPVTFNAGVTDAPQGSTQTFQWLLNGRPIAGATGDTYTVPGGLTNATAGAYSVRVTTRVGTTVIGTVETPTWAVVLADSSVLVYRMTGRSVSTVGAREVSTAITGYFVIDRTNNNAAIIQTFGTGVNRRNSLEIREDIAAYSTGPVIGSRTVFAGSVNSGNAPVEHDLFWVTGVDAFQTLAPAVTRPAPIPAATVFAPATLSGFLGTVALTPTEITSVTVSLAIDRVLSANSVRNGTDFDDTVEAVRAAARAAGFADQ